MQLSDTSRRRFGVALIMLGIVLWGGFHAIGAYRYNHNVYRAVMVVACVAGFLGFWLAMLAARRARIARMTRDHEIR